MHRYVYVSGRRVFGDWCIYMAIVKGRLLLTRRSRSSSLAGWPPLASEMARSGIGTAPGGSMPVPAWAHSRFRRSLARPSRRFACSSRTGSCQSLSIQSGRCRSRTGAHIAHCTPNRRCLMAAQKAPRAGATSLAEGWYRQIVSGSRSAEGWTSCCSRTAGGWGVAIRLVARACGRAQCWFGSAD